MLAPTRIGSCLLALFALAAPTLSQSTELVATFPIRVAHFAVHPSAALIYASLPDQDAVAVIDTESLTLVDIILVGNDPRGLALSPDARRLYVCLIGAQALAVVDVQTRAVLAPIPLPVLPYDVEVGLGDRIFVTPNGPGYRGIFQVDAATGQVVDEFDFGVFVYYSGLVDLSPDRTRLWFANRGLSPGTLACFDVSAPRASLVWRNNHGSLGSNGQDLALTADGAYVSYACGSGNGSYDIFKISTSTFQSVGEFETDAYPREIVYAPDNTIAYTVSQARADRWNAETFAPYSPITTMGEPEELAVDRTGRYLFVAMSTTLRVHRTGFGLGSTTPFCFGDGSGAPCPCGNTGASGRGCENSYATGGALLESSGSPSVAADTFVLTASGLPPSKTGMFFQGTGLSSNGFGHPFGDGLRCAGGTLRRLGLLDVNGGTVSYPQPGDAPISVLGLVPAAAGTTRTYQFWYRNAADFCTTATHNLSNGLITAWLP